MGKNFLFYTDNFYPLQGGAEKHLENLISRLIEDGHQVHVITMIPDFEGYDKEFKYHIHRLIEGVIPKEDLMDGSISEFMWGNHQYAIKYYQKKDRNLPAWKQTEEGIINIINNLESFDVYIGCGQFGARQHDFGRDIAELLKAKNPLCKTFYLEFDMYHYTNPLGKKWLGIYEGNKNPLPNIDYIMSSNYYDLNHKSNFMQNDTICLPPIIDTEITKLTNKKEWENRPYDFGFLSPLFHKGSSIVKSLLIDYPDSKFLIKIPPYGSKFDIDGLYPLLGNNFDTLGWVEDLNKDFYQQCKFILYPSLNEGYGMGAIEALCNEAIPILNSTESNRWVNGEFAYYVESDLSLNPIIYNFDWYMKNYDRINRSWKENISDILRTKSDEHYKFIKYYQEDALKYHQQRFEGLYLEFLRVIGED
jgi:glycosyltransferase involved in cell wall biosynthesis